MAYAPFNFSSVNVIGLQTDPFIVGKAVFIEHAAPIHENRFRVQPGDHFRHFFKLAPSCHQYDGIDACEGFFEGFTQNQLMRWKEFPRFMIRRRVIPFEAGILCEQFLDNWNRRGLPHVIGVRFEGKTEDGDANVFQRGKMFFQQPDHLPRLMPVRFDDGAQQRHRRSRFFPVGDQCVDILWETTPSETASRFEE